MKRNHISAVGPLLLFGKGANAAMQNPKAVIRARWRDKCQLEGRYGADGLKFPPASLIGPNGYKAISAVLPSTVQSFAIGDVAEGNFAEWIDAGFTGFGIGSALYRPGYSTDEIAHRAKSIDEAYDVAVAG